MDRTVHLKKTDARAEASVTLNNVWVTQGDLDGLHDLLVWVEGFRIGNSRVGNYLPGEFDALMFYRKLGTFISEQTREPVTERKSAE